MELIQMIIERMTGWFSSSAAISEDVATVQGAVTQLTDEANQLVASTTEQFQATSTGSWLPLVQQVLQLL